MPDRWGSHKYQQTVLWGSVLSQYFNGSTVVVVVLGPLQWDLWELPKEPSTACSAISVTLRVRSHLKSALKSVINPHQLSGFCHRTIAGFIPRSISSKICTIGADFKFEGPLRLHWRMLHASTATLLKCMENAVAGNLRIAVTQKWVLHLAGSYGITWKYHLLKIAPGYIQNSSWVPEYLQKS